MKKFIKQIIGNVSNSKENADKLGDEESFRDIVLWDSFIEKHFLESLQALVKNPLDPDELKFAETINQVEELLNEYS